MHINETDPWYSGPTVPSSSRSFRFMEFVVCACLQARFSRKSSCPRVQRPSNRSYRKYAIGDFNEFWAKLIKNQGGGWIVRNYVFCAYYCYLVRRRWLINKRRTRLPLEMPCVLRMAFPAMAIFHAFSALADALPTV